MKKTIEGLIREKTHELGTFQVPEDRLIVTDPCYEFESDFQVVLKNATTGTWRALIFAGLFRRDIEFTRRRIKEFEAVNAMYADIFAQYNLSMGSDVFTSQIKETKELNLYRNMLLMAVHESVTESIPDPTNWEFVKCASVDSGQMSISCITSWRVREKALDYEGEETPSKDLPGYMERGDSGPYWEIGDITLNEKKSFGIYDERATVCLTAYGDGGYPVYVKKLDKKIVGVAINFIC